MTRYVLSFDEGTMVISDADLPDVAAAAHRVVDEAKAAGVWIFGGGVIGESARTVATDGSISEGPYRDSKAVIGAFSIVDVDSPDEALQWAAKFAAACRCAQGVRALGDDPDVWL